MMQAFPGTLAPISERPTQRVAAPVGAAAALKPPSLKGAWTISTVAIVVYLFIVHSYKLTIAQEVLAVGLAGVMLFSRPLRVSPPMLWYAAFLAWALVTLPISQQGQASWDAWYTAFKVWLIMFLFYNAVRTPGQMRLIILAWLAVFALYPVRGTLFNFAGGVNTAGRYAWNFTFSNFNDLASLTMIPLALAVDRLRSAESKFIKVCAIAGLVVMPFIILITQSRGGMLGLAAFFFFMIARSRQKLRMSIALVVIGIGAVLFAPQAVWDRIVGMKALRSTETLNESDASAQQRWLIMQIAAKIAAANPVFGVGIGAYPYTHASYAQSRPEWALAGGPRDSHNTYLHIAAENGVLGFALFMMAFGTAYRELRKTARSVKGSTIPGDKELADRCQAYQAAFIALAVCAIFSSLNSIVFPFLFLSLTGIATRMPRASARRVTSNLPLMPQLPLRTFRGGLRPALRSVRS